MSIPFPDIIPSSQEWGLRSNTQTVSSPLTGSIQTLELPGAAWTCQLTYNNLNRDQIRTLSAFLVRLRGQAVRFTLYNHSSQTPKGVAAGTPKVAGSSQTGTSILTSGWTANVTGILLAGDYIGIGGRLKMVVADVNSDSSGNATLTIEPPIGPGMAPANLSDIVTTRPTCTMMLDSNTVKWTTEPNPSSNLVIGCIEDVTA